MHKLVLSLINLLIFFTLSIDSLAQVNSAQNKNDTTVQYARLNINNISTLFANNGLSDYYNYDYQSFLKYPNERFFGYTSSGFVFGGKINEEIRVGGTYHHSALVPAGTKRIFRVRKDYKTGDLSAEINDKEGTEDVIIKKYQQDWEEWPADEGAPYNDINNNNKYEYNIDIPGIPGADQTIWFKANDSDSSLVMQWFKSLPLGLEIEFTYWAYKDIPSLSNTIFRKYKIINKNDYDISEMYCSIQSDFDIGFPQGNLVGCDTLRQMAFIYSYIDSVYRHEKTPPAAGFLYLDGTDNTGQKIKLSSFNPFINLYYEYEFPGTKTHEYASLFWYNLFQGKTKNGGKYVIPAKFGGGTTSFPLSGDPVTKTGWLDSFAMTWNNRGMNISAGPFNLASGASQEVFFVLLLAGGNNNIDRLQAIDSLRKNAEYVHNFYKQISDLVTNVDDANTISDNFILYQNYPNPFNPSTVINYSLPRTTYVTLKVYDILGREVALLINEVKPAGEHKAEFNAKLLPSGVYIYNLIAGTYSSVKKMLLVK